MKNELMEYKEGSTTCEGFAAYVPTGDKRPGILLCPDWMAVTPFSNTRANMLLSLGYNVFVVDMYGKGVRPVAQDACAAEMMKYRNDRKLLRSRARAGLDMLKKLPNTDTSRLGAIGYCFGGTTALELARDGADVKAVVSFHGNLDTPNPGDAKNIKGHVLVLHGADDPIVPDAEVLAFQKEMRDAGVDWQVVSYGNAVHAFTNWNIPAKTPGPAAYETKADNRSWVAMQEFFEEVLH
ncbi:MAG TPA: dienelactone hydrolase family protein [Xanthobacteraceae bacterium]|jgi:dienelactone hydrolase|nr:dienelactone hydrolase family protein [Xanthobacteraceae bacterium]